MSSPYFQLGPTRSKSLQNSFTSFLNSHNWCQKKLVGSKSRLYYQTRILVLYLPNTALLLPTVGSQKIYNTLENGKGWQFYCYLLKVCVTEDNPTTYKFVILNWNNSKGPQHFTDITQWSMRVIVKMGVTYLLTYCMEQSPSWEANWFCS